jgi:anti-sigma B factor antagonist
MNRSPNRRGPALHVILRERARETRQTTAAVPARRLLDVRSYVQQPGVVVITVIGDVDWETSQTVHARLSEQFAQLPARVVIDIARVSFLGSPGVSEFIEAYRHGAAHGIDISLVAAPGFALRTLEMSGVAQHFRVYSSVSDALAGR